jgi:hypothetical protein
MKKAVFWDVAPCSLIEVYAMFQRCLMPPSSEDIKTEETQENLGQDIRFSGRDLNPGPPEYKAIVLTTIPPCSVTLNSVSPFSELGRL